MAKKMVKNEKGFTLIELVIVIVVLGILAAFAVSRYTNMAQSARIAAVNGMAGGLRGAVALVQGQYLAPWGWDNSCNHVGWYNCCSKHRSSRRHSHRQQRDR